LFSAFANAMTLEMTLARTGSAVRLGRETR